MSLYEGRAGLLGQIAGSLSRQPAYLLTFGLVVALDVYAVASSPPWVSALVILGSLLLAGFAIWSVERRTIVAKSPAQAKRLAEFADLEEAVQNVFEGLVANDTATYFVYSSTLVDGFLNRERHPIPFPFRASEKLVTTIRDAAGIARIHSLLQLGGKTENLRVLPDIDLREEDWEANLILIGSPSSNDATGHVLRAYNSPLRFSDDVTAIEERTSGDAATSGGKRWGAGATANGIDLDYAMIVKLKVERSKSPSVYLVVAGIGPTGTLGGCHFLEQNLIALERRFGSDPFALVVSVVRDHHVDVLEDTSYRLTRREDWSRSATRTSSPAVASLSEQGDGLNGATPPKPLEGVRVPRDPEAASS
jgi:hypothetical protein